MARKAKKAKTSHNVSTHLPQQPPANNEPQTPVFTLFRRLPVELRTLIWRLASSEPRNLVVFGHLDINFHVVRQPSRDETHLFAYRSTTPPPAILHVNREARVEALQIYKLDFGVEFNLSNKNRSLFFCAPPKIYINWAADTLVLMQTIARAFSTYANAVAGTTDVHSVRSVLRFCESLRSLKKVILFCGFNKTSPMRKRIDFRAFADNLGHEYGASQTGAYKQYIDQVAYLERTVSASLIDSDAKTQEDMHDKNEMETWKTSPTKVQAMGL
ncbi:hypothetical protein D0Z07_4629 [Hyphodiscus hymeniophilus]|uniref:2EXR domain-containing protein n=1 Tax=Hyphodiscus hymeniophilus TaxID=353542 RepID=A0A9P7AWJ0_9HELO|nr:hypothetical protein D0Z07_4629 [Hyphodiscus hymeniophilus]